VLQQFQTLRNSSWRIIDAAQTVEEVQEQVIPVCGIADLLFDVPWPVIPAGLRLLLDTDAACGAIYGLQVQKHARAACEHAAAGAPLTLLWHEPPFSEPVQETETCLTQ